MEDWTEFCDFLTQLDVKYWHDGEAVSLDHMREVMFVDGYVKLAQINLSGITLNCHFFVRDEIELDVDPRDIRTDQHAAHVLQFMSMLGKTLKKDVILTEEGAKAWVWFRYRHADERLSFEGGN